MFTSFSLFATMVHKSTAAIVGFADQSEVDDGMRMQDDDVTEHFKGLSLMDGCSASAIPKIWQEPGYDDREIHTAERGDQGFRRGTEG